MDAYCIYTFLVTSGQGRLDITLHFTSVFPGSDKEAGLLLLEVSHTENKQNLCTKVRACVQVT